MKNIFLTIDSGGSKTKFVIWDDIGKNVFEKTTIGFGLAEDVDTIHPELQQNLEEINRTYQIDAIACNLGGKNKTQITNTIISVFPDAKINVFRESEGLIGITLCEKTQSQIALLVGTGSIAIAPYHDKAIICGGWGANISDKGSGYDLGLKAICSSLEQIDGTEPMSELAKHITGVTTSPGLLSVSEYCALRDKIRANIFPLTRAHIAEYAKIVSNYAKQGDPLALKLLEQTGNDLANLAMQTANKINNPIQRIVVTGGMVNSKQYWCESFQEKIQREHNISEVVYLPDGISDAMYTIVKNLIK